MPKTKTIYLNVSVEINYGVHMTSEKVIEIKICLAKLFK